MNDHEKPDWKSPLDYRVEWGSVFIGTDKHGQFWTKLDRAVTPREQAHTDAVERGIWKLPFQAGLVSKRQRVLLWEDEWAG